MQDTSVDRLHSATVGDRDNRSSSTSLTRCSSSSPPSFSSSNLDKDLKASEMCQFCYPARNDSVRSDILYGCVSCSQEEKYAYMCCSCKSTHSMVPLFSDHKILPLADFRQFIKRTMIKKCLLHHKALDFYCETCHQLVCPRGLSIDHSFHEVTDVGEYAERQKESLRERCAVFDATSSALSRELVFIDEEIDKLHRRAGEFHGKINKSFDKTVEMLADQKMKSHAKLDTQVREAIKSLEEQKIKLSSTLPEALGVRSLTDRYLELNTDLAICENAEEMCRSLVENIEKMKQFKEYRFSFTGDVESEKRLADFRSIIPGVFDRTVTKEEGSINTAVLLFLFLNLFLSLEMINNFI